jgi:VWFA-related protein
MLRVLGVMLLALAVAAAWPAQDQILKVNVDLVNTYFTVCNKKGRLITDLDRESFSVFEDGKPQVITNFSREVDIPLTIVLLIDSSGSVRDKLSFERDAAAEFLYTAVRGGRDKAALVEFNYSFEVSQDFTDDPALLASAARQIRAGGGTRMYDALYFVLQEKLAGPEERKIIILISDGNDNASRRSLSEVVDLAQRHSVCIYAISMNALGIRSDESDQHDSVLELLASDTGGRAFFPAKLEKLVSNFKRIADDLRSQYTIAYRSTNAKKDGTFRKIRINVEKGRYAVHTRSGYYAPLKAVPEGGLLPQE